MPRGKRETAFHIIHGNTDVKVIERTADFRTWVENAGFRAHPEEHLAKQGYALTPSGKMVLILKGKPVELATKVVVA